MFTLWRVFRHLNLTEIKSFAIYTRFIIYLKKYVIEDNEDMLKRLFLEIHNAWARPLKNIENLDHEICKSMLLDPFEFRNIDFSCEIYRHLFKTQPQFILPVNVNIRNVHLHYQENANTKAFMVSKQDSQQNKSN